VFDRDTPVVGAVVARRASTRVQGDLTRFRQALLDQALQSRAPVYLIHARDPRVDRYYRDGRRGPYLWFPRGLDGHAMTAQGEYVLEQCRWRFITQQGSTFTAWGRSLRARPLARIQVLAPDTAWMVQQVAHAGGITAAFRALREVPAGAREALGNVAANQPHHWTTYHHLIEPTEEFDFDYEVPKRRMPELIDPFTGWDSLPAGQQGAIRVLSQDWEGTAAELFETTRTLAFA
jgi:hypothetical protein